MQRAAAFSVHVFTALGAGVALLALMEAVLRALEPPCSGGWCVALVIDDGVDGPMARRLDVIRLQPNWSGEVLDLVVDFVTYAFSCPSLCHHGQRYALWPLAAPVLIFGESELRSRARFILPTAA